MDLIKQLEIYRLENKLSQEDARQKARGCFLHRQSLA